MERALSAVAIGLLTASAGLADDWLIGGGDPNEVVILNEDRIVDGDLVIINNAELLVSALLVGDLSGDGAVDQADLGLLLASFGIDALGDLDGDDDTDQSDLGLLLANYSAD